MSVPDPDSIRGADARPRDPLAGAWTWAFPATFAIHAAEEYLGGETLFRWISRVGGVTFTREEFLAINLAAFAVMVAVVMLVQRFPGARPLVASLAAIVTLNGALHVIATAVTRSYAPGLVSGALVWLPLGIVALRRCAAALPRGAVVAGIVAGIAAHGLVTLMAFSG